jgi:hypothetical protein
LFYQDFAVSLGCFHDDVRAEAGSWLVVGMIPVFDKKKPRGRGDHSMARMELHAAALP